MTHDLMNDEITAKTASPPMPEDKNWPLLCGIHQGRAWNLKKAIQDALVSPSIAQKILKGVLEADERIARKYNLES
jgi:hypothetical protein